MALSDYLQQKYIFGDYGNQKSYPKILSRYKLFEENTTGN